MKKYKVAISMAVGMSEDVHYVDIEMLADNQGAVFNRITSNPWFHYTTPLKTKGVSKETHSYIQVKHITDIYIREIEEETKHV